jgi:hypothetical protein
VDKIAATIAPLADFVTGQRGATSAAKDVILSASRRTNTGIGLAVAVVAVIQVVLHFV